MLFSAFKSLTNDIQIKLFCFSCLVYVQYDFSNAAMMLAFNLNVTKGAV